MTRRSTIETHPQRGDIEAAIASGVQGKIIARQYGLSETAISRWKNREMARRVENVATNTDSGSADTVMRLIELAESTRRARQIADRTGSPTVKAAAQRAELAVLDRLTVRLGITDLSVLAFSAMASDLFDVVVRLVTARPDIRADVLALTEKRAALSRLTETLTTSQEKTS